MEIVMLLRQSLQIEVMIHNFRFNHRNFSGVSYHTKFEYNLQQTGYDQFFRNIMYYTCGFNLMTRLKVEKEENKGENIALQFQTYV